MGGYAYDNDILCISYERCAKCQLYNLLINELLWLLAADSAVIHFWFWVLIVTKVREIGGGLSG